MILGRHSPDLEGGHCGCQNRALEVGSGVSAFVVCFACIMSFFSFSVSVKSSVSLFLSFLHHVAQAGTLLSLCYISDLCAKSVLSGPLF